MSYIAGIIAVAIATALACSIPGSFVVLRRNSMLVDAIGHSALPGIVIGYLITRNLDSPILIFGAALAGLVVVLGNEYLIQTRLISGDAPQGLIFPALFSLGVLLITLKLSDIHLDERSVLVGDVNLVAFHSINIAGIDIGPAYFYLMLALAAINLVIMALLFNNLKITTFDQEFARTLGIKTHLINALFMFDISLTVTAAFSAVGAILVISLIVIPAATARLLTNNLLTMIALSGLIAVLGGYAGFWVAYYFDASTSSGMAIFYGLCLLATIGITRMWRIIAARRSHRLLSKTSTMTMAA